MLVVRRWSSLIPVVVLVALPLPLLAQQTGAAVSGVVRDSGGRPIADAQVGARPSGRRTRSDSAGRFEIAGLDDGKYVITVRKVGFAAVQYDVELHKGGRREIKVALDRRVPLLDTVTIVAGRECSRFTFDGFVCRRRQGGGVFLDYDEIDEKQVNQVADLFRDMKGFRETLRPTRNGPVATVTTSVPWGCVTSLVDGRPATLSQPVPELPIDLIAVEIYARPDSVPKEYQWYTWPQRGNVTKSGRCAVIVYWTVHR